MSKLEEYGLAVSFGLFKSSITKEESYLLNLNYSSSSLNQYFLDQLTLLLRALPFSEIDGFVEYLESLSDYETSNTGYIHEIVCPAQILFTMDYDTDSKLLSIDHHGGPTSMPILDLIDILNELKVLMEKYP